MGMEHEKNGASRPLLGMNDFMEWSHASLDHVRRCSSRKRAVAGSSSSQTSVNSEPLVVQDDPQGTPPSVDDMFSADPYANRFLYTGREFAFNDANDDGIDDYDSENFSPTDRSYADRNKVDGYVGTPKGQFKHYDHNGKKDYTKKQL
jgi:hypothetical protein